MRHRIAQSALTPLTREITSPRVAELFASDAALRYERAPMLPNVISSSEWALSTGYAGNDRVRDRIAKDLQRMAEQSAATGFTILGENLPPAWARKREFIPIALASSPATTIVKISVLPMRIKDALAAAQKFAESNNLRWAAMARGVGIIYFAILPGDHTEDCRQHVATAASATQEACAKLAGHATIPWAPAEWKSTLQIWGPQRPDFAQMQKVKAVFDPQKTLSPGRFVGGI
jgi:FAD/FMN-containing dehydrogenase